MSAVVIWVADLAKSVAFYSALFETSDCYLSDGFASVKGGGNEVLLHLLPEQYRSEPTLGEDNPIKPIFEVDQIADFAELLRGEIATHDDWNYADLADPDGHIIQIREKA
jgi:catechol 2,3-dioxygenase-like lactoylglutathione lyase family enzyme